MERSPRLSDASTLLVSLAVWAVYSLGLLVALLVLVHAQRVADRGEGEEPLVVGGLHPPQCLLPEAGRVCAPVPERTLRTPERVLEDRQHERLHVDDPTVPAVPVPREERRWTHHVAHELTGELHRTRGTNYLGGARGGLAGPWAGASERLGRLQRGEDRAGGAQPREVRNPSTVGADQHPPGEALSLRRLPAPLRRSAIISGLATCREATSGKAQGSVAPPSARALHTA